MIDKLYVRSSHLPVNSLQNLLFAYLSVILGKWPLCDTLYKEVGHYVIQQQVFNYQ